MPSLVLHNYRCFTAEAPATISMDAGLTAFVGPNNSGKTTLLRAFYELRSILGQLGDAQFLSNLPGSDTQGLAFDGLRDVEELAPHGRGEPPLIEVDSGQPRPDRSVRVRLAGVGGNRFDLALVTGVDRSPLVERQGGELVLPDGSRLSFQTLAEAIAPLASTTYIGPSRNPVGGPSESHYDVRVGRAFIQEWHEWKTGRSVQRNRRAHEVERMIAGIFGFQHLEITSAENDSYLHVVADGHPQRLTELGAGLSQFVACLSQVAMLSPSFVLIDEPELNLHPSLQGEFLAALESLADTGVAFSTHSVGLARSLAERVYSLRREDGVVHVRPLDRTPRLSEFLGEMSYASWSEVGADSILLVEGVHDIRLARTWLKLLGVRTKVVVMHLGGTALARGGVEEELRELTELSDRVFALIDSERSTEADELSLERQGFLECCQAVGVMVHATERRAVENYLSQGAVLKTKGAPFDALGPYERLGDAPRAWHKGENWRIGENMTVEELSSTDVGKFLRVVAGLAVAGSTDG